MLGGEEVVEGAESAGADGAGCGGTERAQTGGAGGVRSAVEEVSGAEGMVAGVGEMARPQLGRGEIDQDEDALTAGGGRELVERGGERGAGCGVVTGLEVDVAGGGEVSGAVVEQ